MEESSGKAGHAEACNGHEERREGEGQSRKTPPTTSNEAAFMSLKSAYHYISRMQRMSVPILTQRTASAATVELQVHEGHWAIAASHIPSISATRGPFKILP